MKFKLKIDCDNETFGESGNEWVEEIARMLQKTIAPRILDCAAMRNLKHAIYDINGKYVDYFEFYDE